MKDRIEINKELVPYTFEILLGGEQFAIRVDYNSLGDMFTLALYKDDELVCAGEPLVYGIPLWRDAYMPGKYPAIDIIPYDESGEATSVTWDNLNRTVFLVVDNQEEAI